MGPLPGGAVQSEKDGRVVWIWFHSSSLTSVAGSHIAYSQAAGLIDSGGNTIQRFDSKISIPEEFKPCWNQQIPNI